MDPYGSRQGDAGGDGKLQENGKPLADAGHRNPPCAVVTLPWDSWRDRLAHARSSRVGGGHQIEDSVGSSHGSSLGDGRSAILDSSTAARVKIFPPETKDSLEGIKAVGG